MCMQMHTHIYISVSHTNTVLQADKCSGMADALNKQMAQKVDTSKKTSDGRYIRYVEIVYKQSIYNYREQEFDKFIKIVTVWPQHVPVARSICQVHIWERQSEREHASEEVRRFVYLFSYVYVEVGLFVIRNKARKCVS